MTSPDLIVQEASFGFSLVSHGISQPPLMPEFIKANTLWIAPSDLPLVLTPDRREPVIPLALPPHGPSRGTTYRSR